MIKTALVGCGGIAGVHGHIMSAAQRHGFSFVACCDEKMAAATAMAEKYGVHAYHTLRDMMDKERPDIVHITTPHYTHVPLSLYALRRGTHVLLEKPAASIPSDIGILINAAANAGKQLGVCFQNRYNPSSLYAKSLLDSGRVGKILGARAFVTWFRSEGYYGDSDWRGSFNTEGTSVLINQSIHTIDLMQWMLGDPETIEASVSNRAHKGIINTEDTAEALFGYGDGKRGLFYASVGYCTDANISLEIVCENLTMEIHGQDIKIRYGDGKMEEPVFEEETALGKGYWGSSHERLIMDFYRHVKENRPFPIDAAEGSRALKTCFNIIESSGKGRPVKFSV